MYNNTHAISRHASDLSTLAAHSRRHTLTDAGARFVAQVSDPFSDEVQRVGGMPDQTSGQSIVYDIRQELTIEAPSSVLPDANFDFHAAIMPVVSTNHVTGVTLPARHNVLNLPTSTLLDVTPVNNWVCDGAVIAVNRVPTGSNTFDPTDTTSEYDFVEVPILVDPTTRARPISIAYEIINETEDLYKSGAITDYRVDADVRPTNFGHNDTVGNSDWQTGLIGNLPPLTLAQAKQVNGVTRASTEGSLVVGCLDKRDLDAVYPRACPAFLGRSDASVGATWNGLCLGPHPENIEDATYCRPIPFMQSGSYATGLAGRSKFRLVAHILVEVFPRPGSELMPLAEPAPAYDAMALELLSEIQSQSLPGYPVSWNGLGKYTRKLIGAVKRYAPAVLRIARDGAAAAGRPDVAAVLGSAAAVAGGSKKKK